VVSRPIRCAGPALGSQLTSAAPKGARDEQEESERAVFADFAEVAGLRCTSIESRRPPEPDILCDIAGDGAIAFELGEVVSEARARATNEQRAVRRRFRTDYDALASAERQAIETCLGGVPAVFVGFAPKIPPGQWRRAVKPVLDLLVARAHASGDERLGPGDIAVWRIPGLSRFLTDLAVRSTAHGKPFFGVIQAIEVIDATERLLTAKFAGRYESWAPRELLVYWAASPAPVTPQWRDKVLASVRAGLSTSRFRRVWCFDLFNRAVVLVYPCTC
jgi:hypothetical protein